MRLSIPRMSLTGIRVIELSGLAPSPYCGRILSDFGADVIRVDKPNSAELNWMDANKRSIIVNLKKPSGIGVIKDLCRSSDVLIDPYRPGVLERLNLGPATLMKENPRLIFARLTGFGQTGPLSLRAGHDINYVALSGILSMLGRKEGPPTPPINLLADFAGGGLLCALGIAMALLNRTQNGLGKVVDCSMAEGSAYVGSFLYSSKNSYLWGNPRGQNWLDSGAHFYDTYETKDGRYMAVGAIEPQFYELLLTGLELNIEDVPHMCDFEENKKILAAKFKQKTMNEWSEIFDNIDACVTPVLTLDEAPLHPHNKIRNNFKKVNDSYEPSPAPKITNAEGELDATLKEKSLDNPPCPTAGQHTVEILKELGYANTQIVEVVGEKAKL